MLSDSQTIGTTTLRDRMQATREIVNAILAVSTYFEWPTIQGLAGEFRNVSFPDEILKCPAWNFSKTGIILSDIVHMSTALHPSGREMATVQTIVLTPSGQVAHWTTSLHVMTPSTRPSRAQNVSFDLSLSGIMSGPNAIFWYESICDNAVRLLQNAQARATLELGEAVAAVQRSANLYR